ncbi:hypothetical protein QFC21_004026 [Naganishia friedmannii]|uniref:Uncharacterized protein n=1 Tax=Naganishia friedmannii TaxID=89922 RepID=A0ACC2VJP7_9TREE|nr:hypothetical protein QFC21_004026 [Naganishia friedmannii]
MPRSFVEREHILTGAWRDTHSPPRYSDVALQLIVYNKANALKNSYKSFPDAIPPKTPQERRDLVEAVSSPMVYHRSSKSFSLLRAAIRYLIRVRYFLHDTKNKEGWGKYVAIALRRADRELVDFALWLESIDKSLDRAIDGVVKKMVTKGKRMHELGTQEEEETKAKVGAADGLLKLVI